MSNRLFPQEKTVAIRCYGQGLGDCFLLAFPRERQAENPCYVVIDCGVAKGTPDEAARMQQVVADIKEATDGHIDVLALTHQHYDHVIGFFHAQDLWNEITVDQLYLPWTEKAGDPEAATIGQAALRLGQAAEQAAGRAMGLADTANRLGLSLTDDLFAAGGESFGVGAAEGIKRGWQIALDRCPGENQRVYCEPGDVLELPGTGVKTYVLGPPRLTNRAREPLVGRTGKPLVFLLEDRREMYSYEDFGMIPNGARGAAGGHVALHASAENGGTSALANALLRAALDEEEQEFDPYCPFDRTAQIGLDEALKLPFFWEHYTSGPDWRRVDDEWLGAAEELALRAGSFTNNISLVLAFELPHTRQVLLFVGDAQVGNWLSWHTIEQWQVPGSPTPLGPADMDDLLGRVAFYKVGHHGSHNATIHAKGLEKMPQGMLAFIPVSVPVAHDIMGYCPMPFYPVLRALQEKTEGAVFLANGRLLEPLPAGASRAALEAKREHSPDTLPPKVRKSQTIEKAVPLYTQFTFKDGG